MMNTDATVRLDSSEKKSSELSGFYSEWNLSEGKPGLGSDFLAVKPSRIRLLDYLPALYREDANENDPSFTQRFLSVFEEAFNGFERLLEESSLALNTDFAPSEFLPWLAECAGLTLEAGFPESKKRRLLNEAAQLYRMRGTRRGLSRYLEIYTGVKPQIFDRPHKGLRLGCGMTFGQSPRLGHLAAHTFLVVLTVPRSASIDTGILRRIIEAQKPAHTAYDLRVTETNI